MTTPSSYASRGRRLCSLAGVVAVSVLGLSWASGATGPRAEVTGGGTTARVSVTSSGAEVDDWSYDPSISADGRFVAFSAFDAPGGEIHGPQQVYAKDLLTGDVQLVTATPSGAPAYGDSAVISADGRFVAFRSTADNLDPHFRYGGVFLRNLATGVTRLVSLNSAGEPANYGAEQPALSADGRFVVFETASTNMDPGDTVQDTDIYERDLQTGITTRVSVSSTGQGGDVGSYGPAVSANGRLVSFETWSTNLVPGDNNGRVDVVVRDVTAGLTQRGSPGARADTEGATISADGRFVAFGTWSANLDPGDTNGLYDVYLRDRSDKTNDLISVAMNGAPANGASMDPSISAHGRYVAFTSKASNLVPHDTNGRQDVFVRDRMLGVTRRVSVSTMGRQGNGQSGTPAISVVSGRYIVFWSSAANLVGDDGNLASDVFLRDRQGR